MQEVAFTLADGIAYVEAALRRAGSDVDEFAPRLSFFFNAHNDFLEEVAKFRAARRLWARIMRERFGAQAIRSSLMLRFHAQTAGSTLHRAAAAEQRRAHHGRRRWPRCWAARSRCTRTATTRRWRCPPRSRRASRCARSRSSPTSRAWRRRRSAGRLVRHRGPHRRDRGARGGAHRRRSTAWAAWSRPSRPAFPQREIERRAYEYQRAVEEKRARSSWA